MTDRAAGPQPGEQTGAPAAGAVLHQGELTARSVAGPVGYRVITPPGWDGTASLPLLLVLHGANSSAATLDAQVADYEELWAAGEFPAAIVACASTPTSGGFYLDHEAGEQWETLVASEFPRHLAGRFNADLGSILLLGGSMGGYGALKIAFREPERFTAVAALEPAIFPGETFAAVRPRNTLGVLGELRAAMAGGKEDEEFYARNHVVARLRASAGAIRRSGLPILVECGDQDCFRLHDGAEYLHRVLWDLDVSHEYRLVRGADHIGPSVPGRERYARAYLAAALAARRAAQAGPPQAPAAFREWLAGGAAGPMPAVDFGGPEGPPALRLMLEPLQAAAAAQDPTPARGYGLLPPLPAGH